MTSFNVNDKFYDFDGKLVFTVTGVHPDTFRFPTYSITPVGAKKELNGLLLSNEILAISSYIEEKQDVQAKDIAKIAIDILDLDLTKVRGV